MNDLNASKYIYSSTTLLAGCFALLISADATAAAPLRRAHAHNDYYHKRPLLDALEWGFCSVEADIFLVNGKLLVAHSRSEARENMTLESLYLDPLRQQIIKNGGRVFRDGPVFTLLVDIKSDGMSTWKALHKVLSGYNDIVCHHDGKSYHRRGVHVIISGNRERDAIKSTSPSFAGIDGRLSDLDSALPPHQMPLISDRWTSHFQWRGRGEFPADERDKLREIVRRAHAKGRRVRFWATPESPVLWAELRQAKVDLINTDKLEQLSGFLRSEVDKKNP